MAGGSGDVISSPRSFPCRGCSLRLQVRLRGLGQAKELSPLATSTEAGMGARAMVCLVMRLPPP